MTQNYWVIAKAQLLLFQSWKYLPCYFLSHFPSLPLCPYRWWSKDTSGPKSVYRDFFFPALLVGQVRQICKFLFFRHGEGLLRLKAYLIFLATLTDPVKDPVFSYKPCPNRYLKNQVRSGKCSNFITFSVLFCQFSAVNISIFDKMTSECIAISCVPADCDSSPFWLPSVHSCLSDIRSARDAWLCLYFYRKR